MRENAFSLDALFRQDPLLRARSAEIWPVFLPVVSVLDAGILYQEALARTDLVGGHQGLIAIAEERGFVAEIDCSVLSQVVDVLRRNESVVVGVNVSAGTVKSGAVRWLRELFDAGDVAARIVVELTETQVFDDVGWLSEFVDACRGMGVRFALDDYESGNFDDELVRRIAPDIVKLSNVWSDGAEGAWIQLSKCLDKVAGFGISDVVVEWIDARWKFDLVSRLPISHAQGLFVGGFLSDDELVDSGNKTSSISVASDSLLAVCW